MSFAPCGKVYLINTPVNDKNQIDFANSSDQHAYFTRRTVYIFEDFTYQRKDNIIRVPVEADLLWQCNYCMYQNANFTDKWFYAYITKIEYINPSTTYLHIRTDVFQTWCFDVQYYKSFVVREHVSDDTRYKHILPEPVFVDDTQLTGEHLITPYTMARNTQEFNNNYVIGLCMSEQIHNTLYTPLDEVIGGVPAPCYYYCMDNYALTDVIDYLNEEGQTGAVIGFYCIPRNYINIITEGMDQIFVKDKEIYEFTDNQDTSEEYYSLPEMLTIDGYTPKNNKLFCYPYNYYTLYNNNNSVVTLRPEDFTGEKKIKVNAVAALNPCIIAAPCNYGFNNETTANYNYSVTYANFPSIPFNTDIFKNYMALHSNSIAMDIVNMGMNTVTAGISAAKTANPLEAAGTVINSAMQSASYAANLEDMKKQPMQMHGTPSGNISFKAGIGGIFVGYNQISSDNARQIDEYLSAYGYNVATFKHIEFKSRTNWNYIQTVDINISGNLPGEDMEQLKSIFNSGVTFWHSEQAFGNYSNDNPIR